VLIDKVRFIGWQVGDEQSDEMDVLLGGVPTTVVLLQVARDSTDTILEMMRAECVDLRSGEGTSTG
jgi:hypothetical protein